ncbi:hypothetical protein RF55_13093 [Lasius niger]|uniref:Uncharacterized protein n=1 Tax=Lasius niger TaxID=67767 RepID=A0A0J7KBD9_LASNI|nr:hypothetical protein RF55_13093 [Lasius niger]
MGASVYFIEEATKVRYSTGATQNKSKADNKTLGQDIEDLVRKFNEDDEYSRALPGIKDYVTIKEKKGVKIQMQKD